MASLDNEDREDKNEASPDMEERSPSISIADDFHDEDESAARLSSAAARSSSARSKKKKAAVGASLAGAAAGAAVAGPIGAVVAGTAAGIAAATNDRKVGHLAREIGDGTMKGVDALGDAGKTVGKAVAGAGVTASKAVAGASKTVGKAVAGAGVTAGKAVAGAGVTAGKAVARHLPSKEAVASVAMTSIRRIQRWDQQLKITSSINHVAIHSYGYIVDRPDEIFLRSQKGWFYLELAGTNLRMDIRNERLLRGAEIICWSPSTEEDFAPARHQVWRHDPITGCLQSRCNGLLVDIKGESTEPGARLITWVQNAKQHQDWDLVLEDDTNSDILLVADAAAEGSRVTEGTGDGPDPTAPRATAADAAVASPSHPIAVEPPRGARCRLISKTNGLAIGVEADGEEIEEGAPLVMASVVQALAEDSGSSGAVQEGDEPKEYFTIWNVVPLPKGICDL